MDYRQELDKLTKVHGCCGRDERCCWHWFEDGTEAEFTPEFGFRVLGPQSPERVAQAKEMCWRSILAQRTQQFREYKEYCQGKARRQILTPADTAKLKELQAQVKEAEPPAPDPKERKRAAKLYHQRTQLAANAREAEQFYRQAEADQSAELPKLGERWAEAYEQWQKVNTRWLAVDAGLQRLVEEQAERERANNERLIQELEVNEIEI